MRTSLLQIPKSALKDIEEKELLFYMMMGHLSNELTVLEKILYLSSTFENENEILRTINNSHIILISKLIAGKLSEGWELLKTSFFNTRLSQTIEPNLPQNGMDSLNEIKKYFSGKNLIRTLRNEYAFHFPVEKVRNELLQTNDSDVFEIFITQVDEPFFIYPEELIMKAILNEIDSSDIEKALERFLTEIMSITRTFRIFCAECSILMIQKYNVKVTFREEHFTTLPNKTILQSPFLFSSF